MAEHKCFGIAGWKDSGKTTLVAKLVQELTSRGLTISTIKHAHHRFDLDQPGTDSHKHREAGANEVVLVSGKRWAIQHELRAQDEPAFDEILTKLSPCDLVIVEGYKAEPIPKLEIIGPQNKDKPLWPGNANVVALACDHDIPECGYPQFKRDEIVEIADFILNFHGISR